MEVSKLEIKLFEFCRPGKDTSGMNFYRRADFLVGGEPLSHAFSKLKDEPLRVSTQLDKNPPPSEVIERFYGAIPEDAAESGRFVLYDFKDDAGEVAATVSCVIELEGNRIIWKDIRSQGVAEEVRLPDLMFDFEDYQAELKDYMDRNPVTKS